MDRPDTLADDVSEAIQETARRFAQECIAPLAAKIDADDWFPAELWPRMGELGLHGITVEEADGGLGLGYAQHLVVVQEIARASGSVGHAYLAHSNLCLNQIRRWGTPYQKARYLPKLISGEWIGALAMSEVGAGSDVLSLRLKADRRGNRFILNGAKFWITNGAFANVIVVYARTGEQPKDITAFIVESDTAGYMVGQHVDKLGTRGSSNAELVFTDCEIPIENALGPVGGGTKVLMSGLDYERVTAAGIQIGLMQACLDTVVPYVRERRQFGQPIGAFQLMQAKVADMYVAFSSARSYVHDVARACDQGKTTRYDAAGALLLASENAVEVALEAVQALGGAGYTKDWPLERILRDAKALDIAAGTNEIRRMLIGRELLKV